MRLALCAALGVGGATITGALLGFVFRRVSLLLRAVTMGAAAGVMFAAAAVGLLLPVFDFGAAAYCWLPCGAVCGGLCLCGCERLLRRQKGSAGGEADEERNRLLLFVLAIALHNLPEGLAAGVGFGTDKKALALSVALGIAAQNLPEGMVVVAPLLAAGFSPAKTLLIACGTGVSEIIGTLLGYWTVSLSASVLPFALSFAGGCMLFVIVDDMLPLACANGQERRACFAFLGGFCLMLCVCDLLS